MNNNIYCVFARQKKSFGFKSLLKDCGSLDRRDLDPRRQVMLNKIGLSLRRFVKNEKGDTVTQVVAIAAGVLLILALLMFGKSAMEFIQKKWTEITSS